MKGYKSDPITWATLTHATTRFPFKAVCRRLLYSAERTELSRQCEELFGPEDKRSSYRSRYPLDPPARWRDEFAFRTESLDMFAFRTETDRSMFILLFSGLEL